MAIPNTRKQQIIEAAATLFKQKGYSAVTMRDIAKAMDIKAASLYNHISSKQAILQDIVIHIAEDFTKGMAHIQAQNISVIEKLNQVIALHVNIATTNPNGLSALNSDWMHLQEKRDYYLSMRNTYEADLRQIIANGIAANEIKTQNTELILFSFLSTLRNLYLWLPKTTPIPNQQLVTHLSAILIHGIKK